MKTISSKILFLFFTLSVNFNFVSAQYEKNSISGLVTDSVGAVLPEAKVVLLSPDTLNKVSETKTDYNGKFLLKNIEPGSYILKISHQNFKVDTEKLITVDAEKVTRVEIELGTACSQTKDEKHIITEQDKANVVNITLNEAIKRLLSNEEKAYPIILSTKNIGNNWVLNRNDRTIRLMDQKDIQQKADEEGDFLYLSFSELKTNGGCIAVSIDYSWSVGKNSKDVHLSGGGLTYEYHKENGVWVGHFVTSWVS